MPVESQTPDHRASGAGPTDALPPAGLPLLGRGRHASPEDGACLMEYTSVLAGLRFSDRPRCTAPTLASVARLINDATSDDARPELARRAPELSVRRHLTCEQSAAVVAGVLTGVADTLTALDGPGVPERRRVRRLRRQAGRERARGAVAAASEWGTWLRAVEVLHRTGVARLRIERAIRALATLPGPDRDRALAGLLDGALERSRPVGSLDVARVPAGSTTAPA